MKNFLSCFVLSIFSLSLAFQPAIASKPVIAAKPAIAATILPNSAYIITHADYNNREYNVSNNGLSPCPVDSAYVPNSYVHNVKAIRDRPPYTIYQCKKFLNSEQISKLSPAAH